jgi:hypothetical protein
MSNPLQNNATLLCFEVIVTKGLEQPAPKQRRLILFQSDRVLKDLEQPAPKQRHLILFQSNRVLKDLEQPAPKKCHLI